MSNRAPECLYLSSGTDDTVMNTLIIYKAPLAQSWNPETQAPPQALLSVALTQNPLETVDVHDLLYMSKGHSCQISVFCDL